MTDTIIQDNFRRQLACRSRFSGRQYYGYTHGLGAREPSTNIFVNEFSSTYRQRAATAWIPTETREHPRPSEIMCCGIYHEHVGLIPNYGGYIPGGRFRFGSTFGRDTIDAKRWLRGDFRT